MSPLPAPPVAPSRALPRYRLLAPPYRAPRRILPIPVLDPAAHFPPHPVRGPAAHLPPCFVYGPAVHLPPRSVSDPPPCPSRLRPTPCTSFRARHRRTLCVRFGPASVPPLSCYLRGLAVHSPVRPIHDPVAHLPPHSVHGPVAHVLACSGPASLIYPHSVRTSSLVPCTARRDFPARSSPAWYLYPHGPVAHSPFRPMRSPAAYIFTCISAYVSGRCGVFVI